MISSPQNLIIDLQFLETFDHLGGFFCSLLYPLKDLWQSLVSTAKRQDCTKSWRQSCALAGQVSKDPGGFWLGSGCNDWKVVFFWFWVVWGPSKTIHSLRLWYTDTLLAGTSHPERRRPPKKGNLWNYETPQIFPRNAKWLGSACVEEFRGRLREEPEYIEEFAPNVALNRLQTA